MSYGQCNECRLFLRVVRCTLCPDNVCTGHVRRHYVRHKETLDHAKMAIKLNGGTI